MSFLSLVGVELKKLKRSKIIVLLMVATVILWLPAIFNAQMSLDMESVGITPEHNFLIQGFLGLAWFIYPASMVVGTVLLSQTERSNRGILKMLSLPINTAKLCMAKFVVLLMLAATQVLMAVGMYFISATIVTQIQNYHFTLSPLFVLKEAGMLYVSSIPMIAFFWLLSVCVQTPIFAIGTGLIFIIPSILMINTKIWYAYPMCYPFFIMSSEYSKLATKLSLSISQVDVIPWIPVATTITILSLGVSCICFGQAERR